MLCRSVCVARTRCVPSRATVRAAFVDEPAENGVFDGDPSVVAFVVGGPAGQGAVVAEDEVAFGDERGRFLVDGDPKVFAGAAAGGLLAFKASEDPVGE